MDYQRVQGTFNLHRQWRKSNCCCCRLVAVCPQGTLNMGLNSVANVGSLDTRNLALYDAAYAQYGILCNSAGSLYLNGVPVASQWSSYLAPVNSFNRLSVAGNITGVAGSSELQNFTTWVLYLDPSAGNHTYITSDFNNRLLGKWEQMPQRRLLT
jgi:hypothetical protein